MAEWDRFSINPPAPGTRHSDAAELTEINHVVHQPAARHIVEQGLARTGIVHDESRMNQTRHMVVWLSANIWSQGSIYGTVQFTFQWGNLITGKQFYWVEAINYGIPAYRILISDKDLSRFTFLTPYDPNTDDGPLRHIGGHWLWNYRFTSEFLVDADLNLSTCVSVKGIQHKPSGCRLYGSSCPERQILPSVTSGRILAYVLSNGFHTIDTALRTNNISPSRLFSYDLDFAVGGLWFELAIHKNARFGGAIRNLQSSKSVVLGALSLLGTGQPEAARNLVALLGSSSLLERALEAIINDHFGTSGWTLPS